MNDRLTQTEEKLLQSYREQILARDYAPLSEEVMQRRRQAARNAVASAAIEGLYATPMDSALFALFDELRAPDGLRREILDSYTAYCAERQAQTAK